MDQQRPVPAQGVDPVQRQTHSIVERPDFVVGPDQSQRLLVSQKTRQADVQPFGHRQRAVNPRPGLGVRTPHPILRHSVQPPVARHVHLFAVCVVHHLQQPLHRQRRRRLHLVSDRHPHPLLRRRPASHQRQQSDPVAPCVGEDQPPCCSRQTRRTAHPFTHHPQQPLGVDVHQPTIVAVGHVQSPRPVGQRRQRPGQFRRLRPAAVPAAPGTPGSRHHPQQPVAAHPVNPVPTRVDDHQPPALIYLQIDRQQQRRLHGRSALRQRPALPIPHHRLDYPIHPYPAHSTVPRIGDVQIPFPVKSQSHRRLQRRRRRRTAVPGKTRHSIPHHRLDHPVHSHSTHPVVQLIGDVQIPLSIKSQSRRMVQTTRHCRTAIPEKTRHSISRHRLDRPVHLHPAHQVILPIGNVQIPLPVIGQGKRTVQRGIERVPAVAACPDPPVPRHLLDRAILCHAPHPPQPGHQVPFLPVHGNPAQFLSLLEDRDLGQQRMQFQPQQTRSERVDDQQMPLFVHRQIHRFDTGELGQNPPFPVQLVPRADHRLDAPVHTHLPHPPVARIGDVHRPVRPHSHGARIGQPPLVRRPFRRIVQPPLSGAGQPPHSAVYLHHPDHVVAPVGHVHRSIRPHVHIRRRKAAQCLSNHGILLAQQGPQQTIGTHHPHSPVAQIDHVQPAVRSHRQPHRHLQTRLESFHFFAVETELSAAHRRADDPVGAHHPHQVVLLVGDVDLPTGSHRHRLRPQANRQRLSPLTDPSPRQRLHRSHLE